MIVFSLNFASFRIYFIRVTSHTLFMVFLESVIFDVGLLFGPWLWLKMVYYKNLSIQHFIQFWVKKRLILTKRLFSCPSFIYLSTLSCYIPLEAKFQVDWGYMGVKAKKLFLFILIYVIALSFFFPKWGHMFLTYQNFSFYGCLSEGDTNKYRKNRILCQNWLFPVKCFFPYILQYPLHVNDHKTKSNNE